MSLLFKFKHTSLIGVSLSNLLLSTQCPSLPERAGGLCRSCRHLPSAGALGARSAGACVCRSGSGNCVHSVCALVAGVVLLVLKSVLDYPGLVATSGSLNPFDVLVIGGQCCLQLLLEGIGLHFGVCIYHCTLMLKCLCIDAVLERNQIRDDDGSIQM